MAGLRAFGILATTAMLAILVMWFITFSPRSDKLFTENDGAAHASGAPHVASHTKHPRHEA